MLGSPLSVCRSDHFEPTITSSRPTNKSPARSENMTNTDTRQNNYKAYKAAPLHSTKIRTTVVATVR